MKPSKILGAAGSLCFPFSVVSQLMRSAVHSAMVFPPGKMSTTVSPILVYNLQNGIQTNLFFSLGNYHRHCAHYSQSQDDGQHKDHLLCLLGHSCIVCSCADKKRTLCNHLEQSKLTLARTEPAFIAVHRFRTVGVRSYNHSVRTDLINQE